MNRAILNSQLMITVDNKVGALAEVTHVISSSGINLVAVCAYVIDNKGFILFVTENNREAEKLLKAKGYNVREEEAILVTLANKPGELQSLAKRIADAGIDVTLLYGSVDRTGKTSQIVLTSEDNNGVLAVLKVK